MHAPSDASVPSGQSVPAKSKIQNPKSKIALLTPLPPARTGIAHYATLIIPELERRVELRAFDALDGYRAAKRDVEFDVVIYQLGNNPHHEWIYREAMVHPGVIVLHDVVLHHLIVEMTLARGDVDGYVAAMEANHGAVGAAWARGRAHDMHCEMANFLMPASIDLANRSRAVIVHNEWAAERLRSFGVSTPVHVVPHAYVPDTRVHDRAALRARLGFTDRHRVIGFFGFLTSAKRAEVVLEAFRVARKRDASLRLLVVGEPAPNMDTIVGDGITSTGYVADEEFGAYYAAADRLVNLRFPSAGETSGTLIRAFDAGKPVAVSDYAQFAEYSDACAFKVPFGEHEVETLADFFLREMDVDAIAAAQRAWLESNATVSLAVDGYLRSLGVGPAILPVRTGRIAGPTLRTLPLFVTLSLLDAHVVDSGVLECGGHAAALGKVQVKSQRANAAFMSGHDAVTLTLRNDSDVLLRTRSYGQPGYRLIAKLFDGASEVHDRWIELPRDLAPGDVVSIDVPLVVRGDTLRLYHAMEGIPLVEPEAFATLELSRVH